MEVVKNLATRLGFRLGFKPLKVNAVLSVNVAFANIARLLAILVSFFDSASTLCGCKKRYRNP